jgi:hypothetical protein
MYVQSLLDQIADLKLQLAKAHERDASRDGLLRHVTEKFVTVTVSVTQNLAIIASGFGGKGGSGSGSPSLSGSPEKAGEATEFQDLNGNTRTHGYLQNGTRVPGSLGDVTGDGNGVTKTVTSASPVTMEVASISDFKRAETELRRKPMKDPEMVAKAAQETQRLERETAEWEWEP